MLLPPQSIFITGAEAACCLGNDLQTMITQMRSGAGGLRPLEAFGFPDLRGGWIQDRKLMLHQRYGPASALAVHLAKRVVEARGWTSSELADACVFAGSSRGNSAGWIEPWPGRKKRRLYAASNNLHGEIASAVSIELGVRGASQMFSNGCASGLDALGMAALWLRNGLAKRAIVISVDLPLAGPLLVSFRESGLLSKNDVNDPYSPKTTGFMPAEAGAALLLETDPSADAWCRVAGYWTNSDAYDSIGSPSHGSGIIACLREALKRLDPGIVKGLCPHANGTLSQAKAEATAIEAVFQDQSNQPTLHLLKPWMGHSLGASGAIETAILAGLMREKQMPPNLPGLSCPVDGFVLPEQSYSLPIGGVVLKLSVAMGGHNALLALQQS